MTTNFSKVLGWVRIKFVYVARGLKIKTENKLILNWPALYLYQGLLVYFK